MFHLRYSRFETFDYSVNSFNSTAQVYELFDNHSYTTEVLLHNYPAFFNSIQVSLKDYFLLYDCSIIKTMANKSNFMCLL